MTLTVRSVLKRPYFNNATILAGKNGLNREVKWVHIVEIARFGHLLNGNEIILTTGVGWANDEEKSLSYLQQLIEYNVAALCIELVIHVQELSPKMLEVANQHNFPIIVFNQEVRFIDITKDLHELLLGYHEDTWWRLERFHQKLNNTLTLNSSSGDFLRVLHQETNKQIALVYDNQYRFFPSPPKRMQKKWIEEIEENKTNLCSQSIYLLNKNIATLYILDPKKAITQFDELALKRCSEILEQFFWKHHEQMETQQIKRNEWILDACGKVLSHEEVKFILKKEIPEITVNEAIIGVIPYKKSLLFKDRENLTETALIMLLRSILVDFGFHLFTAKDDTRNFYVLLLVDQYKENVLHRLAEALQKLNKNNDNPLIQKDIAYVSFGKVVSDYSQLGKSYEAAIATFHYQQHIEKLEKPFYNHLHIYRIIDQMNDEKELREIVTDYIGSLITYDQENNTELVKTLQVYLKNLGSKNETAQELHIVRQTLYHRLQRMEELLGEDYLEGDKRFMIEFSLHALTYIE